jgi:hypothetical protein
MLGALAPELVRLYAIRRNPRRFRWTWFYVVVSVLFAGLGGALAVALPATTAWAALYVGVSTPTLVNTLARKGRELATTELKGRPAQQLSTVDSYLHGL